MNRPLVSICIPTYNNGQYIGKTLESIVNQTYKNIEIIVTDNASTDNTAEVVRSFKDGRIKYFRNQANLGSAKNFNLCIQLAKGPYIAIYHSDDIYKPEIVEKESSLLMRYPNVGAVFCLDTLIDKAGKIMFSGIKLPRELVKKNIFNFTGIYKALLKYPCSFLICPTFMAKKEVFDKIGLFDARYGDWVGGAGDTALWLKIAERYEIGILNERLILRRVSSSSGSGQYIVTYTKRSNHFIVLDDFLNSSALEGKLEEPLLRQYEFNKFWDDVIIAKNLIKLGRKENARKHLWEALSWSIFFKGFTNIRNFIHLCAYFIVLVSMMLEVSRVLINIIRSVKRKPW